MSKKQTKKTVSKKIDKRVVLISILVAIIVIAFIALSFNKKIDYNNVIAKINGKPISANDINQFLKDVFEAPSNFDINSLSASQQKNLIEQYIIEQKILEKARKSAVASDPATKRKIELAKDKILKKAFLEKLSDDATEREVIEEEYKNLASSLANELKGKKEVKVKHILVSEKDDINKILLSIKSGAKTFEDAAKENSQDTHTGKNGGDLGYIAEGSMVKEFEEVAFSAKIGEISAPFKTDFGWHILKVNDKRDAQVPALEDVYFKIKQSISMKTINDYVNNIKDGLQIELSNVSEDDVNSEAELLEEGVEEEKEQL